MLFYMMQSGVKRPLQSPGLGLPYTKQQQLRGPLLPTPEPNQFSRQSMFLIQCHVWKTVYSAHIYIIQMPLAEDESIKAAHTCMCT